jgi:sugar phosphate isomerase/epimerase
MTSGTALQKTLTRATFILAAVVSVLCGSASAADARHEFFAMNTIARGGAAVVVPMLKELGYDGLGGSAGDGAMATALEAESLKLFNGYLTLELHAEQSALDEDLKQKIDAMQGHHTALWIALAKVLKDGTAFQKSSPDADEIALNRLREIADYAESRGVKIALYPHTGLWIEHVEDAIRVADKMNRASVGVTFNLCHWLKVEGAERDPDPVLKAARPRLMFVTINGADAGDTKQMGWDRLIQPLDRGSYDVGTLLKKVRAAGYRGPVGFQGFGLKEEPRAVLERTMTAWRKLDAEHP